MKSNLPFLLKIKIGAIVVPGDNTDTGMAAAFRFVPTEFKQMNSFRITFSRLNCIRCYIYSYWVQRLWMKAYSKKSITTAKFYWYANIIRFVGCWWQNGRISHQHPDNNIAVSFAHFCHLNQWKWALPWSMYYKTVFVDSKLMRFLFSAPTIFDHFCLMHFRTFFMFWFFQITIWEWKFIGKSEFSLSFFQGIIHISIRNHWSELPRYFVCVVNYRLDLS